MKIIRNKFIPVQGYKYCNLFGVLFVKSGKTIKEVDLNHESIHSEQWKELWYIGFILLYVCEWIWNVFKYKFDTDKAYKNLRFEREAYANEKDSEYLEKRNRFAWRAY